MQHLNSVLLEGNLTRDPVLSDTPNGTKICAFTVASDRYFRQNGKTEKEVSFFDIEVWATLAEACAEHLCKGRSVRVVGHLRHDRWTDSDGKNREKVKIVAEHVEWKPLPKATDADTEEARDIE